MLETGQVFYTDYAKPEGFCDEAWEAIYQYVFAGYSSDDLDYLFENKKLSE